GTSKVKLLITKPNALPSGKYRSPLVKTLIPQVVFRRLDIFNVNPGNCQGLVEGKFRRLLVLPVAGIPAFFSQHHQSLKFTSVEHLARRVGNIAIEDTIAPVFGEID